MKIVFLDTSFLRSIKWDQDSDWQKILKMSKEGSVKICVPEIVKNEWRTSRRDSTLCVVKRTVNDFQRLKEEWDRNPFLRPQNPVPDYSPITDEFVDQKVTEWIDGIIQKNKIEVIGVDLNHFQEMLSKYFNWQPPFHEVSELDRDDPKRRLKRRENIPDGIIIEVINSATKNIEDEVYLLCNNEKDFGRALNQKIKQLKTAKDLVSNLLGETSAIQPLAEEKTSLKNFVETLNSVENNLSQKIMGYVKWFSPVEKSKLEGLLTKEGFSAQQIETNAQRLCAAGVIRDTGYHYLPENNDLNQEAANSVMAEVLKIIDDGGVNG